MDYRKFGNKYIVSIGRGEEVLTRLTELCRKENIKLGSITGLGAANHIVIGLFDTQTKIYLKMARRLPPL